MADTGEMSRLILLTVLFITSLPLCAADVVLLFRPDASIRPVVHADLVIEEALRRTTRTYGPGRLEKIELPLVRDRLMLEMHKGEVINAAVVATQQDWEDAQTPIRIPIDMGLSGYRIGLIRQDMQARLDAVKDLTQLRELSMGVGLGWSSRKVLEAEGFKLEMAANQELLTRMLLGGRFDYFPRGVGEVFAEFEAKHAEHPDLAVEGGLLLQIPLPTYLFVSPATPRLAKRLEEGLESMVQDGTLLRMVVASHEQVLKRANLCARRILNIDNPLLPPATPLKRKALWFDPYAPASGLCAQDPPPQPGKPARKKSRTSSVP